MTSRSEVHHANHYSIEASYKKEQILYVELYNVLLFCEVKIEMHLTYNEWILATKSNKSITFPFDFIVHLHGAIYINDANGFVLGNFHNELASAAI